MAKLAGAAAAGLLLGLLPTLSYNAMTSGNPFRPTQGMEIEKFLPSTPQPTAGGPRVGFPSLWKGGVTQQVQGGGLRLENFRQTAPHEWFLVFSAYGWVLLGSPRSAPSSRRQDGRDLLFPAAVRGEPFLF